MPQVMPLRESRDRQERVFLLRAVLGLSWRQIRDAEGFSSVGGAQRAYERHRARNALPNAATLAAEILERKRFATGKAAAALAQTDDPRAVAELVRSINAADADLAKLYGLAPEAVSVTVTRRPVAEVLDDYERELLAVVDADVVEVEP